jgi:low temperature requirement protein LtrA
MKGYFTFLLIWFIGTTLFSVALDKNLKEAKMRFIVTFIILNMIIGVLYLFNPKVLSLP